MQGDELFSLTYETIISVRLIAHDLCYFINMSLSNLNKLIIDMDLNFNMSINMDDLFTVRQKRWLMLS